MKIVRILLLALSICVFLLILSLFTIWMRPNLVINDQTISLFRSWINDESIQLNWETAHVAANSKSFWKKNLSIQFSDFSLRTANGSTISVEANNIQLEADFNFAWLGLDRVFLHDLTLLNLRFEGAAEPGENLEKSEDSPSKFQFPIPSFLSKINYEHIFVELNQFLWKTDEGAWKGKSHLEVSENGSFSEIKARVEIENPESKSIEAEISGRLSRQNPQELTNLELSAHILDRYLVDLQYHSDRQPRLKLEVQDEELKLYFRSQGRVEKSDRAFHAEQELILESPRGRERLKMLPLNLNVNWSDDFRIELSGKWSTEEIWKQSSKEYKSYLSRKLSGHLKVEASLDEDSETLFTSGLIESDPQKHSLWEGIARVNFQFKSQRDALLSELEGSFDADLDVPSFQKLKAVFTKFGILVPAPFHVLEGPLELELHSDFEGWEEKIPFELILQTNLKSSDQKLKMQANADFVLPRSLDLSRAELHSEVVLQDVILTAPDLGVRPPPKLLPDRRFTKPAPPPVEEEEESSSLNYEVKIQSQPNPLRIRFGLAEEPVAIHIDASLSSEDESRGRIWTEPVTLNVFRRKAQLTKASLSLEPEVKESKLDVSLQVDYADYRVFINVLGTLARPEVLFDSEPPLSREDIIAVLLFGSPVQGLDSQESSAVANAQAAFVDRSVTLASMYFLASTPVESVSYNPETRIFRAKVKLPGGLSLSIGSDIESISEVGLIKRLGRGFRIRTEVRELGQEQEDQEISAFLEWLLRY